MTNSHTQCSEKRKKVETTSSVITNRTDSSTFTLRAQDNTRRSGRSSHTQGRNRGIQRGEKEAKLLQRKMPNLYQRWLESISKVSKIAE